MADKQLVNNFQTTAADTAEVAYTSPVASNGTLITSVTAANNTNTAYSYKAYIVEPSGTATTPQVPTRAINPTRPTDVPPELIGQVIPKGGTLQFSTNVAAAIAFTVSGRDL